MQHLKLGTLILISFLALSACSVDVNKDKTGKDKNVDIRTPFGEIHVNKDADVRDTGLPVYAGARIKQKEDNGDEKSANVNISTSAFGIKVVAVEYESDDPPSRLISYYRNQLKKYGNVLECHSDGPNYNTEYHDNDHRSEELKCEGDNKGKTVELKAGTRDNQHIVAIDPQGKGSDFSLVYVHMRGKQDTI
jgi:hypothetical protein